jgi:hypothetical protein
MFHGGAFVVANAFLLSICIFILVGMRTQHFSNTRIQYAANKRTFEKADTGDVRLDDGDDHSFLFLQITDIHLSKYNREIQDNFKTFLNILPLFSPKLVLNTGDITGI